MTTRRTLPRRRGIHVRRTLVRVETLEGRLLLVGTILPPAVTTLPASAITSASATLNESVNPNGFSTDSLFQFSTDPSLSSPQAVITLAGSPGTVGSVDGTGASAMFNQPLGVAVDGSGNVYVADTPNDTIRKITPAGVVSTFAGTAGQAGFADGPRASALFSGPEGVATDGSGNVYVADSGNQVIRKITPLGVVSTLAGSVGHAGSTDGPAGTARFNFPWTLATDGSGNVYVADSGNNTIRKIAATGTVSTLAGQVGVYGSADGPGPQASFNLIKGLAVDGSGNVYVADIYGGTIRKITPLGVVSTFAGTTGQYGSADGPLGVARFNDQNGLAADAAGNVYVADHDNQEIRKITPDGVVTTLAGSPIQIGVADGVGAAARFKFPAAVAVDGLGNVYVADQGNDTIRKLSNPTVVAQSGVTGDAAVPESAPVTGLTAGTTYYFRGVATNPGGTTFGSILSFATTSANARPTTTTVTGAPNPAVVGQDVVFTASVDAVSYGQAGNAFDTVTFTLDNVAQAPVPIHVVNGHGQATMDAPKLTAGNHVVSASYSGGAQYAPSVSQPITEQVAPSKVATTLAVTAAPNPSSAGQPVTFAIDVSASAPAIAATSVRAGAVHALQAPAGFPPFTGSVTIKDGPNTLAVVPVRGDGTATYATSFGPGTHLIVATYGQDPNYAQSTTTFTQNVTGTLAGPRVVAVQRFGFHRAPTTLVVGFDGALNPVTAQNPRSYIITRPGGGSIAVGAATYDPLLHTVTLQPLERLNVHFRYLLQIVGTSPGGVKGANGILLDGAGTGTPGSNYKAVVDGSNLVVANSIAHSGSAAVKLAAHHRAAHSRRSHR